MSRRCIGQCSICGGAVSVHEGAWMGVLPPKPSCSLCGATARADMPTIPMELPENVQVVRTDGGVIRIVSAPNVPMGSIGINPSEWTL